jgi:hypothetical protein
MSKKVKDKFLDPVIKTHRRQISAFRGNVLRNIEEYTVTETIEIIIAFLIILLYKM